MYYLKTRRRALKITQDSIASYLGMKKETWRDIENGKSRIRLEDFLLVCKYLNVDPLLLIKDSKKTILILDDDQIDAITRLNEQIEEQRSIQINDNSGNIFINSSNNKISNFGVRKKK